LASVFSSLLEAWLIVLQQVFSHISLLSERFSTKLAGVGLDAFMHPHMVEKIPSSEELFSASIVFSSVNDYHLAVFRVGLVLALVWVSVQLLQIAYVSFRSLILDNIPKEGGSVSQKIQSSIIVSKNIVHQMVLYLEAFEFIF
jgi:hypothetical protein